MFRTTDLVLIAVMVAAAGFTYVTKHGAEAELAKLRNLESAIRLERDAIDLLRADWSLLTQPSRLQRLAEAFDDDLQLQQTQSYQYGQLSDLPAPVLRLEDVLEETGRMAGADSVDDIVTGGVGE